MNEAPTPSELAEILAQQGKEAYYAAIKDQPYSVIYAFQQYNFGVNTLRLKIENSIDPRASNPITSEPE
jgi:hypothetical protein